jgi:Protochlamydia outer membrane protein
MLSSKCFQLVASLVLIFFFSTSGWAITSQIGLSGGLRSDKLDWNIAGIMEGTNPNILSELTWKDVRSYYLDADIVLIGEKGLYKDIYPFLRVFGGYGWIFDGDNTDSDYLGDNRTLEFLGSESETNDDNVWDVGTAMGLSFQVRQRKGVFSLAPYAGYTYRAQNFRMTDGVMVVNEVTGELGPFPGLDSTFEARWYGPLLGGRLEYRVIDENKKNRFVLWGEVDYSWFSYKAEANWNLRTDLAHPKSFEHTASGNGYKLRGGGDYFINPRFSIGVKGAWTDWTADDDGVHKTYFADGSMAKTKLNEVNWKSWSVSLALLFHF